MAIAIALFITSCTKNSTTPENNDNGNLKSAADQIAGKYKGTGKFLSGGVSLGNTPVCSDPPIDYETLFKKGDAAMTITKLTDSTVLLSLTSTTFPSATYAALKVKKNVNTIDFYQGYFDINSKVILFSGTAPNFSYSYSKDCMRGLPYYSSFPVPASNGNLQQYYNGTIGHYDFTGEKQD